MKVRIYKMENCPHCEKINYDLAKELGIEIVDIHKNYDGFVPEQLPMIQMPGLTLPGPQHANTILNLINYGKTQK